MLFTQGGTGTTPGYSALDLRRSQIVGPIQEGVYAAGDYQVTQRAAGGAARFVDVAAGGGAFAVVQGDALTGQGLYVVGPHSSAVITEAIATPDVTNPRIDIAVLEVFDNTLDASGLNIARVRIIAGTPTAGTTLNSRAGVAALPGSALLLADILVTANAVSVSNTQIRDRRKWARGAHHTILRSSADYMTTSGSTVEVDATNLKPRIECSGVPLRVSVGGWIACSAAFAIVIVPMVDGTQQVSSQRSHVPTASGSSAALSHAWTLTPVAGSHLLSVGWNTSGGTATMKASGPDGLWFAVEELIRQDRSNGVTTSG